MKFSDGEKLTLMMLCDLYEHLKISGDVDHQFVRSAITSGNLWALKQEYPGIFHDEENSHQDACEVYDILDMWQHIEGRYAQLSEREKQDVDSQTHPYSAKFSGFDGNSEGQFGIARFVVHEMEKWPHFRERELNSHRPTMEGYRRMLKLYQPRRSTLIEEPLSPEELIELLNAQKGV